MKNPTLKSIRAKARKTLQEIELQINTADHWNRTHPDEKPIEVDADGFLSKTKSNLEKLVAQCNVKIGNGEK